VFAEHGRQGTIEVTPVTDAADTLGADDILHGAFCAHYVQSCNFIDARTRASEVSTLSCRTFGTRHWATAFT
jgi:sugar/nucleoside kinase (ribokinase family)